MFLLRRETGSALGRLDKFGMWGMVISGHQFLPTRSVGRGTSRRLVEGKWRDLRIFPSTTAFSGGPPPHRSMGRNRIGPLSTQITQSAGLEFVHTAWGELDSCLRGSRVGLNPVSVLSRRCYSPSG
ncbi:hypothetical protein SJA_C1-14770 [Sphingobium indicum UT26S]|uniref:Uncharacterized protein n=1 Tax=Sphingobium indicum (strain DSM 16413 / CCM 7287 / MTCC 6362 / UT26 / NBRC 101211 / UT26S) TaxID=452662 RepID=D4Z129_SPHIU|nr:hypothetical protein SJA_C1-14770 [Sphingobium indicum UT26S]